MNVGRELLLIDAVATVGVLHTLVPDHLVPSTLMAPTRLVEGRDGAPRRKPDLATHSRHC
jgi:hypothetical protein